VVRTLPTEAQSRRFAISVLVAFLPSAVLGLLFYGFIKRVLFESPTVICVSLIVGGAVLLLLERFAPTPRHTDAMKLSWPAALGVGFCQAVSMVPGVSRSGATIMGGLLLGLDKRTGGGVQLLSRHPNHDGGLRPGRDGEPGRFFARLPALAGRGLRGELPQWSLRDLTILTSWRGTASRPSLVAVRGGAGGPGAVRGRPSRGGPAPGWRSSRLMVEYWPPCGSGTGSCPMIPPAARA
jgi:hypothetical protein